MADKNYQIATIRESEEVAIKKAESDIQKATGKDYVMIAWEKK